LEFPWWISYGEFRVTISDGEFRMVNSVWRILPGGRSAASCRPYDPTRFAYQADEVQMPGGPVARKAAARRNRGLMIGPDAATAINRR
jgi:hypothetical protein